MCQKMNKYAVSVLRIFAMLVLLINSVTAQVMVSLTVKPPYSSQLNDYRHLENRAVITLVNTSSVALLVKITGSLTNIDKGISIQTNTDYRPSVPITIAPHGTTTVTANPGAMNFLDQGNATTNASDNVKQDVVRTGLLPEGVYRLCLDAVDFNTGTMLSTPGQGCTTFNISLAQPPTITYPLDGQTIPATQKAPTFSWTPPIGNLAGAAVRYKLVVVEVIPGQNPNDAISVARDYKANNPTISTSNMVSQIYVTQPGDLPFTAGHTYAAQVIASDVNGKLSIANNGQSAVTVFHYGGSTGTSTTTTAKGNGDCSQLLADASEAKKKADAAFKQAALKRIELFNTISKNDETVYSARAQKILSDYTLAKNAKHDADSAFQKQSETCNDIAWQQNDRKENPIPVYCDLEKDLRDSVKRIDSLIAEKRKQIDSLGVTVSNGVRDSIKCNDSLKKLQDSATAADKEFKKAEKNKDQMDKNRKGGKEGYGGADIDKAYEDAKTKKGEADSKVKVQEDKCKKRSGTVAEARKAKDVTLPGDIKKLEGDAKRTDSLIDDCKKKKAEEEDRWRRRREETARIDKERADKKDADAATAKFNGHIIMNIYNYECICSKEYWDSKGIWDWLPDAINKPVSDALEDKVGMPIPLDALNALLGLYQVVGEMKDPCTNLGCRRIADAVTRSREINPKTGQPWDGTEKCEQMCEMIKKIKALKK